MTNAEINARMIHYLEAHQAGKITQPELEGFLEALRRMVQEVDQYLVDLAIEYEMIRSTSDFHSRSEAVQRAIIKQIRKLAA